MLQRRLHAAAGLVAFLCATAAWAAPQWVIVNAKVFTADPAQPQAEALAIEDGKFSAVGTSAHIRALAGPATRVVDAGGRLVTPGLVEAHVHLGWNLPSPPLKLPGLPFPGPSGEQTLAAVAEAAKSPGDWISAWIGQSVARDGRNWRSALDAVAPDRPVLLRGFWGHTTIVNSAASRRLGIPDDTPDPMGGWWGRDANGRLDGHAHQGAEDLEARASPPDAAQLAIEFREAAQRYARWGVTSIHLMNSGRSLEVALDALARAKTAQKWTVYSWARHVARIADAWAAIDSAPKALPPRVRIDGPKWILDGTPIEQNAFRREPYAGRPDWRGRSNYQDAELREILATALGRPEQLALHVVGDAETDRLLVMMESLGSPQAWKAKRVRVEHGDGIRRDTLDRAVRLGVVVTQNPLHQGPPPPTREPSLTLLGSLLTAGVPLALGSDAGPDEANPFLNIMLANTYRSSPSEALTREQALRAYTAGGAFAERQERFKGRIAKGMAADLAVLSQDILAVPVQTLPATRSLLTLVDGEIAFEDPSLTAPAVGIEPTTTPHRDSRLQSLQRP